MDIRPPWQGPDFRPKDLEQSTRALSHGSNPNEPVRPKSDLVMHNKWGILKTQHDAAVVTRSLDFEIGMDSKRRRDQHRALLVSRVCVCVCVVFSGLLVSPRAVEYCSHTHWVHLKH